MATELGEFIRSERDRFETMHNNMFAFAFSAIQRYRSFLATILTQYRSAATEYLAVHRALQASFKPGTHKMTDEQMGKQVRSERLGEDVQLQIESAYLFAKILLDRLARAVEFYFGPARGLALDSHDDLTKRIERYAEDKQLQLPPGLAASAAKLKLEIADFRDYQIAHHKSPRTFRGFSLGGDEPRMLMGEIYPTAKDKQYESRSPRELIEMVDMFTAELITFLVNNRDKCALRSVQEEPTAASQSMEGAHGAQGLSRKVGILAYGSLIGEEGPELTPLIVERIDSETPFRIEFARSSKSRGYGPTLVPVASGGASVKAKILVIDSAVTVETATNMLYRREMHDYEPQVTYRPKERPDQDDIVIETLNTFGTVETVLYTRIGANIPDLTAARLAELAIASVGRPRTAPDGISYLIAAKDNGIVTPLSPEYEREVLQQTQTASLLDALRAATPAQAEEKHEGK
jgi:hypothetical protein